MSKIIIVPIIVTTILLSLIPSNFQVSALSLDIEDPPNNIKIEHYQNAQLYFVENQGQLNNGKDVDFYVQTNGFRAYFERDTITYQFIYSEGNETRSYSLKQHFIGSSAEEISGLDKREAVFNYFSGNDPERWHFNVPTYSSILYEDIYPNIDLEFIGSGNNIKYNFLVEDNPKIISFTYDGQSDLEIDKNGDLMIKTPIGILREKSPYVYQIINGKKVEVGCKYNIDNGIVSFSIEGYNKNYPLVIDPLIEWSTYLGGSLSDIGYGIDSEDGYAYITGITNSNDFPIISGAYDLLIRGSSDIFVTKISQDGSFLIYSTYIGGSGMDQGNSISVEDGYAYITGETESSDFPTTLGAYDTSFNGGGIPAKDGFITKLSQDGSSLVYSTFFGSTGYDEIWGIAAENGYAYVTGYTAGAAFPTTANAFDKVSRLGEGFVTKLSQDGSSLVYSTCLGGSDYDRCQDIALENGCAYVIGTTTSTDFPISLSAFCTSYVGNYDTFVTKVSEDGDYIVYSTYIGSSSQDYGNGLDVDNGYVYLTGCTQGSDFPITPNAFDKTWDGGYGGPPWDVFVCKLSQDGSFLEFSTFLGGDREERGSDIVTFDNYCYITGFTFSSNFPTTIGAYKRIHEGGSVIFLSKISSDKCILEYSTFLGRGQREYLTLENNHIFVAGDTSSPSFPVTDGAYDTSHNLGYDAFVLKTNIISDWNERPSVTENLDETGTKSGNIVIPYTLTDSESNPCSISVEYCYNGSWYATTEGVGSDGTSGLSSSSSGVSHSFVWNSTTDIGQIYAENIQMRIKANDGDLDSEWEETGSFTVNNNSAPLISDISNQVTNEDTPIGPISFTVSDAGTPANNLQVSASSSNQALVPDSNIVLSGSDGNRSITITPLADQHGATTITVTVSDGIASSYDSFTLTVNSLNDGPIATDDTATVFEDSVDNEIDVLSNDSDPENDELIIISASDPLNGTATIVNSGKLIYYNPNPDFVGTDSFTYTISDENNGEANATVTINVTNINDEPRVIEKFDENGLKAREILVPYSIIDNDSNPCSISVQYYELGIWNNVTLDQGGDGTINLSASPDGVDHVFVWDSREDIKYKHYSIVKLRIKANDGTVDSPWAETDYFVVKNNPIDIGQIFNNLVVYRLKKVNELMIMLSGLYPGGFPADIQQKLVLVQQHVDNANSTESPVKSAYELMEAIEILEEILEGISGQLI
jgi:hypothetical protein